MLYSQLSIRSGWPYHLERGESSRHAVPYSTVPYEQVKLGFEPLVFLVGAGWAPSPGADAPAGWDTDEFDLWPTPTQARSALGCPHGRACVTDRPRTFVGRSEAAHRALQLLRRTLNSIGARVFVLPAQAMVRTQSPAHLRARAIELSMEHAALLGTPGSAVQCFIALLLVCDVGFVVWFML